MIQRIQSVWLLIAAIVSTGLFVLNIMHIEYMIDGEMISKGITLLEYNHFIGYLLAILAVVLVALPLIAIFMFKNRKRQRSMALLTIVLNIGFVAFYIMSMDAYKNGHKPIIQEASFSIAAFLPIIAIIFLVMAMRGITKDIKTVKSLDRLR